ncbi:GntR family transcriptional regulator [Actinoplanes palleronii]|uniref:GntR family transcriptional regulator n=1 Tax=Actinoplanes palleronii TaxID=113570 RepID=UPI001940D5F9|nr:GntR family transcriptional regulator [Actinoplanes palleronii]
MTSESTRSERVYEALRGAVLHGEFAPQQPLKPQELATRHGVSLAVAREALLRLVGEGLALRLPNRGFVVPSTGAERWQRIAEARTVIEPAMLRMAIERGDLEWETRVRAAHHRLAGTPAYEREGDPHYSDAWAEAHRRFHRALLDGCGNDVLLATFDRLWTDSELARRWSTVHTPDRDGAAEHRAIEEAALARDADGAAELLCRHVSRTVAALPRTKKGS